MGVNNKMQLETNRLLDAKEKFLRRYVSSGVEASCDL